MIKITKQKILKELSKLSTAYPLTKYTNKELMVLLEIWFEDFSNTSEQVFCEALRLHRQRSSFFPAIADIKKICTEIHGRLRESIKALPEVRLPEAETKMYLKQIRDKIKGIGG